MVHTRSGVERIFVGANKRPSIRKIKNKPTTTRLTLMLSMAKNITSHHKVVKESSDAKTTVYKIALEKDLSVRSMKSKGWMMVNKSTEKAIGQLSCPMRRQFYGQLAF